MKKVVIAGASGFIGKFLADYYAERNAAVFTISRTGGNAGWDDPAALTKVLEGADLLINLAGKSVNCRYTDKNKKAILNSRITTTKILGDCIRKSGAPPSLWVNAGTATIYRHAEDRPMTEDAGEIGQGFSVDVAKAWEAAFFSFKFPQTQTRQVVLRMAIVLGEKGGVILPLKNLVRCGLGGKQGNGKQMFSWIHIKDLARVIDFVAANQNLSGSLNCAAPNPVSNETLMNTLRDVRKMPFGLPASEFMLKAGAAIIGTETELILKSRWVIPARLSTAGFQFNFPDLTPALKDIFHK